MPVVWWWSVQVILHSATDPPSAGSCHSCSAGWGFPLAPCLGAPSRNRFWVSFLQGWLLAGNWGFWKVLSFLVGWLNALKCRKVRARLQSDLKFSPVHTKTNMYHLLQWSKLARHHPFTFYFNSLTNKVCLFIMYSPIPRPGIHSFFSCSPPAPRLSSECRSHQSCHVHPLVLPSPASQAEGIPLLPVGNQGSLELMNMN